MLVDFLVYLLKYLIIKRFVDYVFRYEFICRFQPNSELQILIPGVLSASPVYYRLCIREGFNHDFFNLGDLDIRSMIYIWASSGSHCYPEMNLN